MITRNISAKVKSVGVLEQVSNFMGFLSKTNLCFTILYQVFDDAVDVSTLARYSLTCLWIGV